jgi:four helix bundle protein
MGDLMKTGNVVQEKSYAFAIRVVRLYRYLTSKRNEHILSRQLLRSGTSIGANIEEAIGAHSRADFFAKITIAYKETRETHYWLRLLRDSDILTSTEVAGMLTDAEELLRLIGAIQNSTRSKPPHS